MVLLAPVNDQPVATTADAAARPARGKPLIVGLLHNVKPNGDVIIRHGFDMLVARGLAVDSVFRKKPTTSEPVGEEALEALRHCDVVFTALACCGSCTSFSIHDAVTLERLGVPTVVFVTDKFMHMARRVAQGLGFPVESLRIVELPHEITHVDHEIAIEIADRVGDILEAAVYDVDETAPVSASAPSTSPPTAPSVEHLQLDGLDDEAVMDHFRSQGWTDGLPIVLPTADRVDRMIGDWDRHEALGLVPPGGGLLTIESLAVNAVMAGCLPSYFPVVVAAARAILQPAFQLLGVNATTAAAAPVLIVNGPIAAQIGLEGGGDVLGAFHRANVTIGRAIRLVMIGVGNCRPQDGDMATHGQSAKVGLCFTENMDESPWESLAVEHGYAADANVLTAVSITGQMNILDFGSRNALDVLKQYSRTIATPGLQNVQTVGMGPLLCIGPVRANLIAEGGFSKQDVQRWLYEHARVPLKSFSAGTIDDILRIRRPLVLSNDPDATVPIVDDWRDINIVVAGGVGAHGVLMPTFVGAQGLIFEEIVGP